MKSVLPVAKDLVLIGGGHSHVTVLKAFGMKPMAGLRITLISPTVLTPYSGMLPGYIAGHYREDETNIDLGPLCQFAGVRLIRSRAVGLDLESNKVLCHDRPPVAFDLLSINAGSTPDTRKVEGAAEHSVTVKPIDRFIAYLETLEAHLQQSTGHFTIGVVGAGAAGVELILALKQRFETFRTSSGAPRVQLHLLDRAAEILAQNNRQVRRRAHQTLVDADIKLHLGHPVARVAPTHVEFDGRSNLELDSIIWATDAMAPQWLADTGLALDNRGFVQVSAELRSVSHPNVFAAGDTAAIRGYNVPRAGVYAVREGPPLAENLRRAASGAPLITYKPQQDFLRLISTGKRSAIAARGHLVAQGPWAWRYKDWIDQRFMKAFNVLPPMPVPEPPALAQGLADATTATLMQSLTMQCRGCGAKVGQTVLSSVLQNLYLDRPETPRERPTLWDDAASFAVPAGKLLVQSVDVLTAIVDDPYLFGRIAALHALGDIYAMGAKPLSALAIATLPPSNTSKAEELLFQLMSGSVHEFDQAGATVIGGHTGEAGDVSLGFTVNGLADAGRLLAKGGLQPGDQLVLCKPLGTGVLFAAEMRLVAKGSWIDEAISSMCHSNARAASILAECGATACTDVTGFGLLGHLGEMLRASSTSAELRLSAIPALPGVFECFGSDIESSGAPKNMQAAKSFGLEVASVQASQRGLLFDPQTCGGLLAGIPAASARQCVDALQQAGYDAAAVIGEVKDQATPFSIV